MSNYQNRSDRIFNDMEAGKISRVEFYSKYNELYLEIPDDLRKSLKRRMDFKKNNRGRCLGQFALDIYDSTKREKLLVLAWGEMVLETRQLKSLVIRNSGADNTGRLLIDSNNGKPDYEIEYEAFHRLPGLGKYRKRSLEVKFTGQLKKLTYKVKDLKSYIAEDALVLTIVSDGMIGPNGNPDCNSPLYIDDSKLKWFIMSPTVMSRLLNGLPNVCRYEMGNKPCVQLQESEFATFLDIRQWGVK